MDSRIVYVSLFIVSTHSVSGVSAVSDVKAEGASSPSVSTTIVDFPVGLSFPLDFPLVVVNGRSFL